MSRMVQCGMTVFSFLFAASALNAGELSKKTNHVVTKRHGPWMIQVVAMKSQTAKRRALDAKRGEELVRELRKLGIPAYLIVRTINVERGAKKAVKPNKYSETVVLAGNYESVNDAVARKTLDYVRRMADSPVVKESKLLREIRKPLRQAFLRPNPFL